MIVIFDREIFVAQTPLPKISPFKAPQIWLATLRDLRPEDLSCVTYVVLRQILFRNAYICHVKITAQSYCLIANEQE